MSLYIEGNCINSAVSVSNINIFLSYCLFMNSGAMPVDTAFDIRFFFFLFLNLIYSIFFRIVSSIYTICVLRFALVVTNCTFICIFWQKLWSNLNAFALEFCSVCLPLLRILLIQTAFSLLLTLFFLKPLAFITPNLFKSKKLKPRYFINFNKNPPVF